jgi:chromosome segregation ATPase
MPDLEKLKERQKKLEQQRKAITARIRKAEIEERNKRYMDAAKELEELFQADPALESTESVVAICEKYFGPAGS